MKIAIVGCGAVGSYYGAMLGRAGADAHFLLRSDYEHVRQEGVAIRSPAGDFVFRPACAREAEAIGPSDVVFIALKATANAEFRKLLPPLVHPGTAVVTLQNGLGNEEQLAELFPAEQILGGLCFVCLNRIAPGVIQHQDYGRVVLGEFRRRPLPRTHALAATFRHAGVPCEATDDLARAHWEKLVWNIPFNGLGVASAAGLAAISGEERQVASIGECLTTDQLLADASWEGVVRELMMEIIAAANALGHRVDSSLADQMSERTRTMGAYKPSTVLDFERRQPLELETLFLAPLRQARATGVAVPCLARLCEVLRQLDPGS